MKEPVTLYSCIIEMLVLAFTVILPYQVWLKFNSNHSVTQIIAAVSYQIVPADTQYAEIPLAVVASAFQRVVCQ